MARERLPAWLRNVSVIDPAAHSTRRVLRRHHLHSVCEEARCPNRGECFSRLTATFMILGDACTRRCAFCAVSGRRPGPPDPAEPGGIAQAVREMRLRYAVITSVTRDDLPDGGAGHFAAIIRAVRAENPAVRIEVLVPDFQGDPAAVQRVLAAAPDVFNHNLETVPRLYPEVRPQADYRRSLDVLRQAAGAFPPGGSTIPVKSGLMVGLGETGDEVLTVMADLRKTGCGLLTIGQYLQPSRRNLPVARYVPPDEFREYERAGLAMGFQAVFAGPLVRSSYAAESVFQGLESAGQTAEETGSSSVVTPVH